MVAPAPAVKAACTSYLGHVGAVLALLGVVVLPITSGDTAMRCCRLMVADIIRVDQGPKFKRYMIAIPLFVAVILISRMDFGVIWRYFGWSNQMLSCFTLWSITVLLRRRARWYWISLLPACFMTVMCTTYLLYARECGIEFPLGVSSLAGIALALICTVAFFRIPSGCDTNPSEPS